MLSNQGLTNGQVSPKPSMDISFSILGTAIILADQNRLGFLADPRPNGLVPQADIFRNDIGF